MGNATAEYGPTGTGYGTGTASYPTQTVYSSDNTSDEDNDEDTDAEDGSDVDSESNETAAVPNNNAAGCNAGSQPTTTIYETELVTKTVTNENTETVNAATATSATSSAAPSQEAGSRVEYTGMVSPAPAPAAPEPAPASPSPADAPAPAAAEPPAAPPVETAVSPAEASEPAAEPAASSTPAVSPAGAFYETGPTPAAAPAPAPAPEAASPPATGSSGSNKRGLAYNSADTTKAFSGGSMSWAYNWAATPDGELGSGIEYVPMCWGPKAFGGWEAAAKSALAAGAKNLLSFNEPDHAEQANMDSASAAKAHIEKMNPFSGQARIGSPAVTNGGPSGGTDGMGLAWLGNFFDKCAGQCKVDFINVHWYDSASNVPYFKKHIQDAIDLAKKNGINKVWLTEFAASGSDAEVANFLGEVLPWLDSNEAVERYAYFMCADGKLVNGGGLSAVGKAYAG